MASPPAQVSVITPIQPAIERARQLLFRPFNLATWFTIGFCAWLAGVGQTGFGNWGFTGLNPQGRFPGSPHASGSTTWQGANEVWEQAKDQVMGNLAWILPLAIVLVCLIVALGVIMVWVMSRGEFMFLHCVALGRAEVAAPWRQHARKARSLFFFRLVLGLLGAVLMLPLAAFIGVFVFRLFTRGVPPLAGWLPLIVAGLGLLVVGFGFAVVAKLTRDLVLPIMFLHDGTCRQAWRELLGLFAGRYHLLVLYLLFQIVLGLMMSVIVLVAVIATCCVAACLMAIPYIGTVLLLPVLVFQRAYSLYYLAQLGPRYDLFQTPAPPPVSPA